MVLTYCPMDHKQCSSQICFTENCSTILFLTIHYFNEGVTTIQAPCSMQGMFSLYVMLSSSTIHNLFGVFTNTFLTSVYCDNPYSPISRPMPDIL